MHLDDSVTWCLEPSDAELPIATQRLVSHLNRADRCSLPSTEYGSEAKQTGKLSIQPGDHPSLP